LVGEALIRQLVKISHPHLTTILIANSKRFLISPNYEGIHLPSWKRLLQDDGQNYTSFNGILNYLGHAQFPVILIDCTASEDIPKLYPRILEQKIHIATPNKKGISGPLELYEKIQLSAVSSGTMVYYEATVGAGLPIISTLQDLYESGDRVDKIEGIFSGTLSYIFNVFGSGDAKFSEVVKRAKEMGYTEPDPRDDLNGMDVARKLTILARTIGMEIEGPPSSSIFPIESLIPAAFETVRSGDEFVAGLPAHDAEFDEKRSAAKREGKVLRYVGSIEVASKAIKVGLQP
jgi:homoserine dehydrogenase